MLGVKTFSHCKVVNSVSALQLEAIERNNAQYFPNVKRIAKKSFHKPLFSASHINAFYIKQRHIHIFVAEYITWFLLKHVTLDYKHMAVKITGWTDLNC